MLIGRLTCGTEERRALWKREEQNGVLHMNIITVPYTILNNTNFVHVIAIKIVIHSPQHFSIPCKFFSASRMSSLIWIMPASM